jgi:P-type conjugative transfer protein TrbJ
MHNKTILSVTAALIIAVPFTSLATVPVIDYSAIGQLVTQTLRQGQQYAQQVQQYQTQLQQLKIEAAQVARPAAEIYRDAQQVIQQLQQAASFFQSGGGLQNYLSQFKDINGWVAAVNSGSYQQSVVAGSTAQKQTNDQLVQAVVQSRQQLQADASELNQLNQSAQSADGTLQAINAANQYAAAQLRQLQEMQALLIAQQAALAARAEAQASEDAARKAANQKFEQWNVQLTEGEKWKP